ncbi:hypothetical protein LWC33_32725 [Pseudonocardia sp. RS11V-5]|uniref:hypothetical protein n=1 Tax=Pseudonocardia terrae TaxID=2905831 RepID=UPI001E376511|nr:hypothetical protein [Pseudonocardia terrae]MCE3556193.1 hypothetical protein [Pseudonocardia terrae]
MRPGRPRRAGLRATARAVLTAAVGLLLTGGGAAVLHNDGGPVTVAFLTSDAE